MHQPIVSPPPAAPPLRLDARPVAAPGKLRPCLECGAPHARAGLFCGAPCRASFNNRRQQRGAVLYDLWMALRFDRTARGVGDAWRAMCRAASAWRDEDRRRRDGRKSWRPPREVLTRTPALFSQVADISRRKQ